MAKIVKTQVEIEGRWHEEEVIVEQEDLLPWKSDADLTFVGINFGTFAQKIQADLAEAGIDVSLAPTEVGVALESYREGKEPFGLWIRLSDYRDSVNYVEFLPGGVVGKRFN